MESKRLFRSETDKLIGGVCGGLAEYLNVDSSIVRIVFVLISIWGGSGLLLYIVLWLIVPTQSSVGVIGEDTIKQNTQDMEQVAKKVVSKVEEKVDDLKKSNKQNTTQATAKPAPAKKKPARKTSTSKKSSK